MAKNLKLKVKNAQLAEALKLNKNLSPKKKKPEKKPKEAEAKLPENEKVDQAIEAPALEEETQASKPKKATDQPSFLQPTPHKKPKATDKPTLSMDEEEEKTPKQFSPSKDEIGYIRPGTDKATRIKKREEAEQHVKPSEKKAELPAKKSTSAKEASTEGKKAKTKTFKPSPERETESESDHKDKGRKPSKFKEFKESSSLKKFQQSRVFDSRDRQGLRNFDEDGWRRRKHSKQKKVVQPEDIIRPKSLHIKMPISVKDLAASMKYKSADLIQKLFLQGIAVTINDFLDDETTVQLLGEEFGCAITIDTSEEERLRITDKSISEEIAEAPEKDLSTRPPIITFMGHVDHGKTSLIDAFRKSNITSSEAGAITQHIGAFRCKTPNGGVITLLDTPGHEAFTTMRTRGANVTDLIVIVVAGDEGIKQQTDEAIVLAKDANVPIIVAINKSDKSAFNPEEIYRQLADRDLLPEAWGGSTVTVNCSAVTKQGLDDLLELVLLQAELLELKANPKSRARGVVIESEMQKGLGNTATLLIQNGTLHIGDSLVIEHVWGRVKTMHDEKGYAIPSAMPSVPVHITGISDLPDAGAEFIVVKNEREARKLCKERSDVSVRQKLNLSQKSLDSLLQKQVEKQQRKILNVILKTDVHGSIEAIESSLREKIYSEKANVNIISSSIGAISESDIEFAAASNAVIIGFHVAVEMHAEPLIKQLQVEVHLFDVIYHLIDKVKELMTNLLDKVRQENYVGTARVQQTFKSSQLGIIAGCLVADGVIKRNHFAKLIRNNEQLWEGHISSLKRLQDDVKEVSKGLECGILLQNFADLHENDEIKTYEVTYVKQEL